PMKETAGPAQGVTVEIKGKLVVLYSKCEDRPVIQVKVGATTYTLAFEAADLRAFAETLDGQTVLVRGALEEQTVHVSSLEALPHDSEKRSRLVKIKGKVEESVGPVVYYRHPIPNLSGWEIVVNGAHYELDFGGNEDFLKMVQALRGRTLVVTGRLETTGLDWLEEKAIPRAAEVAPRMRPVRTYVAVTGLAIEPGEGESYEETVGAEMVGTLMQPTPALARGVDGCSAQLLVNGQVYWLDLGQRRDLEALADQLKGKKVLVKARLEKRLVSSPWSEWPPEAK